jgi:hypothetical protein
MVSVSRYCNSTKKEATDWGHSAVGVALAVPVLAASLSRLFGSTAETRVAFKLSPVALCPHDLHPGRLHAAVLTVRATAFLPGDEASSSVFWCGVDVWDVGSVDDDGKFLGTVRVTANSSGLYASSGGCGVCVLDIGLDIGGGWGDFGAGLQVGDGVVVERLFE